MEILIKCEDTTNYTKHINNKITHNNGQNNRKSTRKDILKFNEIRKYLKYFHLKEIASSADREKFITGIPYESTWKWPESPMTPRWRLIWSRLMKKYAHLLTETKIMREIKQESNNIFQVIASLPKDYQRLLGRIRIKKFFDIRNVSKEVLIGASDGSGASQSTNRCLNGVKFR